VNGVARLWTPLSQKLKVASTSIEGRPLSTAANLTYASMASRQISIYNICAPKQTPHHLTLRSINFTTKLHTPTISNQLPYNHQSHPTHKPAPLAKMSINEGTSSARSHGHLQADIRAEELIKSRPLMFETRPFSRLNKRNIALQALTAGASPAQQHAEIDLDFAYFSSTITRTQLHLTTTQREITRYGVEKSHIEETAATARETLVELRSSLAASQQEKAHRLEYDAIASDILEALPRLKPRAEQELNLARLNDEIRELQRERDEYGVVWAARRAQFEQIVTQLKLMSAQIKEDKEEQDRREGMSEEEEEGEEVEGPTAKSGGATPAQGGATAEARLGLPVVGTPRPGTPGIGGGATPQPVVDEKEEGEEDEDDVVLGDAPPPQVVPAVDRMDMS